MCCTHSDYYAPTNNHPTSITQTNDNEIRYYLVYVPREMILKNLQRISFYSRALSRLFIVATRRVFQ